MQGLPPRDGATIHLALPCDVVLSGTSARELQDQAHGALPPIRVHQFAVPSEQTEHVDGVRVARSPRMLADCFLSLDRIHAICVADSMLQQRIISVQGLVEAEMLCVGRPGVERSRPWWSIVDGRAESPLETRGRIGLIDENLPPDALQYVVRSARGLIVARSDMAFFRDPLRREPRSVLLVEADGAQPHSLPDALFRDRRRQNALVSLGHDVLRYTWADALRPPALAAMVRGALPGERWVAS